MNGKHIKFILFSLIGIIFFLVPIPIGGDTRILLSHATAFVENNILTEFLVFTEIAMWIILIGTILFTFIKTGNEFLDGLFKTTPLMTLLRSLGAFLYLMVLNNWFASYNWTSPILSPDTGGLLAGEGGLLTTLFITFFVGIIGIPFLTHFGAVEFLGILTEPFMYGLFRIPGFATVDAITSFVGDGTLGLIVTDKQFQRGYYSRREAYLIATNFSIVGIAFATAVAEELGLGHIFPLFYITMFITILIIAFITGRFTFKKFPDDDYYSGESTPDHEITVPYDKSRMEYAYDEAAEEADKTTLSGALIHALKEIAGIYVSLLPVIMAVGTLSLIIIEYTPVFDILSVPLVYLYNFLGFPSDTAQLMGPASIAGLADMYLPTIFITQSASQAARFFIGILSFTQLIFMAETGMVLVDTEIGFNILDVIWVFVYRTLLSIPILYAFTMLFVQLGILVM
ncbi:MAG TPA: YjiH family protein [Alloiococcus sp.]|nr:YjiH family protein [Alloiococcus sp.]